MKRCKSQETRIKKLFGTAMAAAAAAVNICKSKLYWADKEWKRECRQRWQRRQNSTDTKRQKQNLRWKDKKNSSRICVRLFSAISFFLYFITTLLKCLAKDAFILYHQILMRSSSRFPFSCCVYQKLLFGLFCSSHSYFASLTLFSYFFFFNIYARRAYTCSVFVFVNT